MVQRQTLVMGFLLACVFSFVLNAQSLRAFFQHDLTIAHVGGFIESADETYFFALIQEARNGFLQMGNSSLKEHRSAPSLTGYALLPQGILARFTPLTLTTVILLGDLIFPALIAFFVFLIVFRLFGKMPEAILFSLAFLASRHIDFLRTMNPQVTMSVFFLWVYLFISDDCRFSLPRGFVLALAVLVQPIVAILLVVIEALNACTMVFCGTPITSVLRTRWILFFLPILAGMLQYFWVLFHTDPQILADLSARRGLIPTHIPSDPTMSAWLLLFGGLWALRVYRLKLRDAIAERLVIFAFAGLIVLQQHVFHGHEAIFSLYYRLPLTFFLWLLIFLLVEQCCRRWVLISALTATFLLYAVTGIPTVRSLWREYAESSKSFSTSGIPDVFMSLESMQGERIVLAPIEVSNLVPVFTSHYTLFTQYAHYEYVSDEELAERYVLLRSFFPLPDTMIVEGDPVVFGLYAGNLYGKEKTFCRIQKRLGFTDRDCDAKKLSDYIRHQDLRRCVEKGNIDAQDLLKKYHVDTVISDKPLPPILASQCKKFASVTTYILYDCEFR